MRRMITEKDVEKLDSIKPSEIEKLGAMQDPKTATSGQILTASADGKATFQNNPASLTISRHVYQPRLKELTYRTSSQYPGYVGYYEIKNSSFGIPAKSIISIVGQLEVFAAGGGFIGIHPLMLVPSTDSDVEFLALITQEEHDAMGTTSSSRIDARVMSYTS